MTTDTFSKVEVVKFRYKSKQIIIYGFAKGSGMIAPNMGTMLAYIFIEAPLNFMDRTFHKYMKIPTDQIGKTIIEIVEKNPKNCDFSLLWHNTYFTDYKYNTFIEEYKKIISFIYEAKIKCVTPDQLIKSNILEW